LKPDDADLVDRYLHVRRRIIDGKVDNPKTERSRRVLPLSTELASVLQDQIVFNAKRDRIDGESEPSNSPTEKSAERRRVYARIPVSAVRFPELGSRKTPRNRGIFSSHPGAFLRSLYLGRRSGGARSRGRTRL